MDGTSPALLFWGLLLVCHGLAFVTLQLSFQRGTTLATAGLSTLLTNVLPILAGLLVFAEHMPEGAAGFLRGLGFAGAVLGATLLAATNHTERPLSAGEARSVTGEARSMVGEARSVPE